MSNHYKYPDNFDDLKKRIKDERPNLSDNSIRAYASSLNSLYKKACSDKPWYNPNHIDIDRFNDVGLFSDALKDTNYKSRKAVLSALFVLTSKDDYRTQMLNDINQYNDEIDKQEKTESQNENWITTEQLKMHLDDLKEQADEIYKKDEYTMKDLMKLQNYVIVALTSGFYIPPRRLTDYTEFKIKNINKEHDNYLDKSTLVFNRYKTAKFYGTQVVKIPKKLKDILTKFIAINPTDYLFFTDNGTKITTAGMNARLNKIFMGKISTNQLRHTYLTDRFSNYSKKQRELDDIMKNMGSSSKQLTTYVKLR